MKSKAKTSKMVPESSCDFEATCCNHGSICWGSSARLWWAVTWRTFLWVSLPVMLVQLGMAWLQTPEMAAGILGFVAMMFAQLPSMISNMFFAPEFWFFTAVTVYSIVGAMFVYGYLARKGTFGGVTLTLTRTKK